MLRFVLQSFDSQLKKESSFPNFPKKKNSKVNLIHNPLKHVKV